MLGSYLKLQIILCLIITPFLFASDQTENIKNSILIIQDELESFDYGKDLNIKKNPLEDEKLFIPYVSKPYLYLIFLDFANP